MKRPRRLAIASFVVPLLGLLLMAPLALALDVDDILQLKRAGVTEETILRVVEDARAVLRLSVDDILDLKAAGCSDDLIHALLDTPERFGPGADVSSDQRDYRTDAYELDVYDYSLYDDDYETVFVRHYYDPFAYYWYPWPRAYFYWSPFWWSHAGFYYAGHWCRDWWDPWGPCTWYCDWNWGYHRHFGPSHTRMTARRTYEPHGRGAATRRMDRQAQVHQRAGLELAPDMRVRSTTAVIRQAPAARSVSGSRALRTTEQPPRVTDRTLYRRDAAPDRTVSPRISPAPPERSRSSRSTYRRPESGSSRSPAAEPRRSPAPRRSTEPGRSDVRRGQPAPAPSTPRPTPEVAPPARSRSSAPGPAPSRGSNSAQPSPRSSASRSRTRS